MVNLPMPSSCKNMYSKFTHFLKESLAFIAVISSLQRGLNSSGLSLFTFIMEHTDIFLSLIVKFSVKFLILSLDFLTLILLSKSSSIEEDDMLHFPPILLATIFPSFMYLLTVMAWTLSIFAVSSIEYILFFINHIW